jgi:hypothetical protein
MGEERGTKVEERRVVRMGKMGMGSGRRVRVRYIGEEGVRGKERGEVSWERPCASWSGSWSSELKLEFGIEVGVWVFEFWSWD